MHKGILNLVQVLPWTSLLWDRLQSPPKHPNAQSAHPEPWQELPALGHLTHIKDRTSGVRDAQESLAGVYPGAVPAQGGAEAQGDMRLYAARHQEAGWEHFTFLERKVCWCFLEFICAERIISEWWLNQVTLVNINWLGCRKFSSCHYSFLFPSLHMSSRTHKKNNLNTLLGLTSWRMRRDAELSLLTLQVRKLKRSYKEITQKLRSIYEEASSKKLILRPNSSKKIHFKGFWYLQVHFLRADINDTFLGTCRHRAVFAFKTTFGINEKQPQTKGKKKKRVGLNLNMQLFLFLRKMNTWV